MIRLFVLLLLSLSPFSSGQNSMRCKGLGQYCTYHTDCCSNSCLTYSYKCVERHEKPNEDQPISMQNMLGLLEKFDVDRINEHHDRKNEDQPISVQNIEELLERFGGDSTTNTHHTDTTIVTSTMDPVETDQTTFTTNDVNQTQPICRANGASCSDSSECCSNICSEKNNYCIHATPNALSPDQNTFVRPAISSQPSCFGIGHKCYNTGVVECCPPLRCHGYLHQCVT